MSSPSDSILIKILFGCGFCSLSSSSRPWTESRSADTGSSKICSNLRGSIVWPLLLNPHRLRLPLNAHQIRYRRLSKETVEGEISTIVFASKLRAQRAGFKDSKTRQMERREEEQTIKWEHFVIKLNVYNRNYCWARERQDDSSWTVFATCVMRF